MKVKHANASSSKPFPLAWPTILLARNMTISLIGLVNPARGYIARSIGLSGAGAVP